MLKLYIKTLISDMDNNNIRYYVDDREQYTAGYKFNEWEMKGVPIRLEIGPRDINNNQAVMARRDIGEKETILINGSFKTIKSCLLSIQENLFSQAKKFQEDNTFTVNNYNDFKTQVNKGGFIRCGWDGSPESENKIKEETKATIRCILTEQNISNLKCIYSDKPAQHEVIFSKAY